jgi:hypothetical protein
MPDLRQSTAVTIKLGAAVDSTDGNTDEAGLAGSMVVKLSKAGGALAARNSATAITYDADGWYNIPLNTTDTNTAGPLLAISHPTGALHMWQWFNVLTQAEYDKKYSTGVQAVNVSQINSSATAAQNLEDAFTGAGFTATGLVIPTVTAITNAVTADIVKVSGSTTAADILELLLDGSIVYGQAVAGTLTTTQMTTNLTETTNDHYVPRSLVFIDGALKGQGSKAVTDYDGATKKLVFEALTEAPSVGAKFLLL